MLEEEALIGLRDGRADCLHRVVEVGGRDDGGVLLVAQRADGRLAHERGEIGAAEAVAPSVERHSRQVHVGRQRSATGSCVQNVHSRLSRGKRDVEQFVQPARPQHRGVDDVRPVGRGDDEHLPSPLETVHLGQHLVDESLGRLRSGVAPAPRHERVQLVKEDDAGRRRAAAGKEHAHGALRLAHVLIDQLGAFDRDERSARLVGNSLCEKRLPAAGRAVEQHATRGRKAESLETLGLTNRLHDGSQQLLAQIGESADVGPRNVWDRSKSLTLRRGLHLLEARLKVAHPDGERRQLGGGKPAALPAQRRARRLALGQCVPRRLGLAQMRSAFARPDDSARGLGHNGALRRLAHARRCG
mmetsp:Transcript_17728/g.37483  ORF Transcript_17728/g.37483 Transcript_17728/m.37483 type:complete len:358 (+) Transcript_17728:311-1384(+)